MFKRILLMFTIIVFMSITVVPFTAYADEPCECPVFELDDELEEEYEICCPAGLESIFDLLFSEDFVFPFDFFMESEPIFNPNPFTPDGHATVIDTATNDENKRFYTFTTPAGNVFYLIIDLDRTVDNVYFLNAVTERDLLALTEESINNDTSELEVIPAPLPIILMPETEEEDTDNENEAEAQPEQTQSNTGMIIFVLVAIGVIGGLAYYIKIVKPKQQSCMFEDDDEAQEDDNEEIEFEDDSDDDSEDEPEDEDDRFDEDKD